MASRSRASGSTQSGRSNLPNRPGTGAAHRCGSWWAASRNSPPCWTRMAESSRSRACDEFGISVTYDPTRRAARIESRLQIAWAEVCVGRGDSNPLRWVATQST
jgi:hypothetical protein